MGDAHKFPTTETTSVGAIHERARARPLRDAAIALVENWTAKPHAPPPSREIFDYVFDLHKAVVAYDVGSPPISSHVTIPIEQFSALRIALAPLAIIAARFDANELDGPARKFWGKNGEHEMTDDPRTVALLSSRGGTTLLTLADAFAARAALSYPPAEPPAPAPPETFSEASIDPRFRAGHDALVPGKEPSGCLLCDQGVERIAIADGNGFGTFHLIGNEKRRCTKNLGDGLREAFGARISFSDGIGRYVISHTTGGWSLEEGLEVVESEERTRLIEAAAKAKSMLEDFFYGRGFSTEKVLTRDDLVRMDEVYLDLRAALSPEKPDREEKPVNKGSKRSPRPVSAEDLEIIANVIGAGGLPGSNLHVIAEALLLRARAIRAEAEL